jgi:hypothetical protein
MKKIFVTTSNAILKTEYGFMRIIPDNNYLLFELNDSENGNVVAVMLIQDSQSKEKIAEIVNKTLHGEEEIFLLAHLGKTEEEQRCRALVNYFIQQFPGCRCCEFHHERNGFLHLLLRHESSKDWSLLADAFDRLFPPRSQDKEDRLRILSELMCDPTSLQKHLATCKDDEVLEALRVYAQAPDLVRLRDTILKPFQS